MVKSLPPKSELSPERREALEREAAELQADRTKDISWSFGLLLLGMTSLVIGCLVTGRGAPPFVRWFFFLGGYFLTGLTVAIDANRKGHSPAWGLLSIPGLAIIEFLPNRKLQRYDEVIQELEGTPSAIALQEDTANVLLVPFWGLYVALRARRTLREKGMPTSVFEVVIAAMSTIAVVVLAGALLWFFRTDEIARGKLSVVRLPRGWADVTASYRDKPNVDVAVESRNAIANLFVRAVPNDGNLKLENFAEAVAAKRLEILGASYDRIGPTIRTTGERKRIEYMLQGRSDHKVDSVEVLTFWETPRHFWMTSALTAPEDFGEASDDLRFIADNVFSNE